jgi:hypothetical protein
MLTLFGLKVSYETLLFFVLFIASEVIGNSKLKENSVLSLLRDAIGYIKPLRREDDKIQKIKDILRG